MEKPLLNEKSGASASANVELVDTNVTGQNTMDTEEAKETNYLAELYYSESNCLDEGPGSELPIELQKMEKDSDSTNRIELGVYLKGIPPELEEKGLRNLCNKYGRVKGVYPFKNPNGRAAVVIFMSVADAENCCRSISSSNLGIKASFKRSKPREDTANGTDSNLSATNIKFYPCDEVKAPLPNFSNPADVKSFRPKPLLPIEECDKLQMLEEYYNVTPNNNVLSPDLQNKNIVNGRVICRHSTEVITKMQKMHVHALGVMDITKHEFVHNGTPNVCDAGECKKCGAITLAFCKGCKEFFCSLHCWNELKRTAGGCSCVSPKSVKINGNLPTRGGRTAAIGRGGKIKICRSLASPSPDGGKSISSNDSDGESVSSGKWGKRIQMLREIDNLKQQADEIPIQPCDLPSDTKLVTITYIVNHNTVFLRSVEAEDNDKYLLYLNDIAECSKTAMPLKEVPEVGDVVLAEHEGNFYRAMVARIENEMAVVAFLEIGNLERKSIHQLKVLRKELKYEKKFIFKALLTDLEERLKSDKCLTYLYRLAEQNVPLKFYKKETTSSETGVPCELIVNNTNENVNGKLKVLNIVKEDTGSFVAVEDIHYLDLTEKNTVVTVIDNSTVAGYINVVRTECMEKINLIQQRIAEYCKSVSDQCYTPRHGEVCLAKCDNTWYRVIMVYSYGDKKPLMQFIDFGNQNLVKIEDMRPMPLEFKYPNYSVFVEIGDFPDQEGNAENSLRKQQKLFPILSEVNVRVETHDGYPKIFI